MSYVYDCCFPVIAVATSSTATTQVVPVPLNKHTTPKPTTVLALFTIGRTPHYTTTA
jgi:hypothetical protein